MCLAFVVSLYLRDLKILVEEMIISNFKDEEKSLLRRILVVRFVANVIDTYKKHGVTSVLLRILKYMFGLAVDKYDSSSSTLFNDVPKLMVICLLYVLIKYAGVPNTLLVFSIFLCIDMIFKSIGWLFLHIFNSFGWIVKSDSLSTKESKNFRSAISTLISSGVIYGMIFFLFILVVVL